MPNELMRPIDEDTARAIQEAAKTGSKLIDAATGLGGYADRVLGRLPDNLVGLVIGDWLIHKRVRRWAGFCEETKRILERRGVSESADVSPSIAVPLIEAAIDEDREGLKEIWARLLAAAMDPAGKDSVRLSLIETVKKMDPVDALVLQKVAERPQHYEPNTRDGLAPRSFADVAAVRATTRRFGRGPRPRSIPSKP